MPRTGRESSNKCVQCVRCRNVLVLLTKTRTHPSVQTASSVSDIDPFSTTLYDLGKLTQSEDATMAAKNTVDTLTADTWTLLSATATAVATVTVQHRHGGSVLLMGTPTEVAPTDADDGIILDHHDGYVAVSLADLFPGVTAPARLYAKALTNDAKVFISHA